MSEVQAPYGVADAPRSHPNIVTLVDKVTYCRAVQFDASDESIDALRLLTGVPTLELYLDGTTPYVSLFAVDCLEPRLYVGEWLVDSGCGTCSVVQDAPLAHLSRPGTLNFSQAVQLLLDGKQVRRTSFADPSYTLSLSVFRTGRLIVNTKLGGYAYNLKPDDLTATDWQLVESADR